MSYETTSVMLRKAQAGGYAVGAFNIENLEMAQAVTAAALKLSAPVILQTTAGTLRFTPPDTFAAIVSHLGGATPIPVALHLDHGDSFDLAVQCAEAGYTSLMMDGSALPFEENVSVTRRVAEVVKSLPLPVEGELGAVGGKEDGQGSGDAARYTDPDQAAEFVDRTGISSLAVAIGTAHGIYASEPKLDLRRLAAIRERVQVPLVLHGTSGVPFDVVKECVRNGVCKVNVATDLRVVFTQAVRDTLAASPDAIDPKVFLKAGRAAVQRRAEEWILALGSAGRAAEVWE